MKALEFEHLTGNTWYFSDATNIGVYVFRDHSCLLIDSGAGEASAKKVLAVLAERGITVYGIFNTHAHADHCGGNQYLQEKTGCRIYASGMERVFLENPVLLPALLYSAAPLRVLKNRFLMPHPSRVSDEVTAGVRTICGEDFEYLPLSGHTPGHMGLRTPDDVVFVGDCVMTEEMMERLPIFFLTDVSEQWASLERLGETPGEIFVPSHGAILEELSSALERNSSILQESIENLCNFLQTPRSREEVVAHTIRRYALPMNSSQYYLLSATLSAFLAELHNSRRINSKVIDGIMKFYQAESRRSQSDGRRQIKRYNQVI